MAKPRRKSMQEKYPEGGQRNCLKCGNEFFSTHLINNRICRKCNRDNRNTRLPKTFRAPDAPNIPQSDDNFSW